MKTIKFLAIILTVVFITTSCVENSGKYKSIVAQRDSLAMEKQLIDSNYNQTLVLLNDIESGFSKINESQSLMKVNLKGIEGKKNNKREIIGAQMQAIKETLEQNRQKIEELKQLAAKNGKTNTMLSETIKRLQKEMDDKVVVIETLQLELDQKNIKIVELTSTIDNQSRNIAEQQTVLEQQTSTIKVQDTDLNTVWYCIASSKRLKEAKVITAGGLFKSKKVLDTEFDNTAFTQVDMRNISSIPTNSKSIKILSIHPQNTYNLVKDDNKLITIEITNPSKFWSVSKYLVVQI
jgi:hypothetical protein